MRKIAEQDIFKEAYSEIDPDGVMQTSVIDKAAFDINITPGSLIGALTGAAIASKKMREEVLKNQMENDNAKSLSGNYYSQVQNIAQGLRVIFTPFGITYLLKNKGREVSLDTVETEEMNRDMYSAWQHKDEQYFKNLLLNKMYGEMQMVEQHFAKSFLENQLNMQNQIAKRASEEVEDLSQVSDVEMFYRIANIKEFYGKHTPTTEKIASILFDVMNDGTLFKISWQLDRPIEKYAGLADKLSFLGFGDGGTDIKKYTDPNFLMTKAKVGFMPDRVVFIVEDKILSTLMATNMSEEAFQHFENQDKNYFMTIFKAEVKQGLRRMGGQIPPNSQLIEKKASYDGLAQIFERGDIHPEIYFLLLTRKYGAKWMAWDSVALIKILETDFNLQEGIQDIPLNKILSIQAANRSDAIYTQHHALEKVIRAFNNKPINFMEREIDDMTIEDVAFGLETLEKVTPHDNIYQNLTHIVFNHIVDMLLADENKLFYPTAMTEEEYQQKFINELNSALLNAVNEQDIQNIEDSALESKAIQQNEMVFHIGLDILNKLKQVKKQYNTVDDEKFIGVVLDKVQIPLEADTKEIIKKHVLKNIEMDTFLVEQINKLNAQKAEFQL